MTFRGGNYLLYLYSFVEPLEVVIRFTLFEIFTKFCPSCSFKRAIALENKPFSVKYLLFKLYCSIRLSLSNYSVPTQSEFCTPPVPQP